MNTAFIFVKPHAVNPKIVELSKKHLGEKSIKILSEGELKSEEILSRGVIDDHYAALAASAVKTHPKDLQVSDDTKKKFEETFGVSWATATSDGTCLNLKQFQDQFPDLSSAEVEKRWRAGTTLKLAPGNYVSKLVEENKMVINGFYGSMRDKYTTPGVKVYWMLVEFEEAKLPWKAFRGDVIGATDPTKAPPGSLRRKIYEDWKDLDLTEQPSTADNGIHASAGPVEGLRERQIWLGSKTEEDPFGKALIAQGISGDKIQKVCLNEVIELKGEKGPAFDLLEDMDSGAALELLKSL